MLRECSTELQCSTVPKECNTGNIAVVPRADPQINIRIPAALKSRLDEAAEGSGRSLTAEVVRRLEDSFGGVDPVQALEKRVAELERLVKRKR